MGKFYGPVGYGLKAETAPGVFREIIDEKNYSGDVIKNMSKQRDGENLNSNMTLDDQISILADPFAYENFHAIRYVQWMGANWRVTSVKVERPRLILTIGGIYNEQKTSIPSTSG